MPTVSQLRTRRIGQSVQAGRQATDREANVQDLKSFSRAATEYTTPSDFCRTFKQDIKRLYLLSLLLTGGRRSAVQCFVSSLGDCLDMKPVFKDWTDFWTRHIVVHNAIRMLSPAVNQAGEDSWSPLSPPLPNLHPILRAVLRLNPFERFVFVMSVLEGYSDRDCSLLLGSSTRDVMAARSKALEHLGRTSQPDELPVVALGSQSAEGSYAAVQN